MCCKRYGGRRWLEIACSFLRNPVVVVLCSRERNSLMEYRLLGGSGLKVSALSFGTATFGGGNAFFSAWGKTDVEEATRLIDICLEGGITLFDTADAYSGGLSEE